MDYPKRPHHVKIGVCDWDIYYDPNLIDEEECFGETLIQEYKIKICSIIPEAKMKVTLLHEMMHVIASDHGFYPTKGDGLEEAVIMLFCEPIMVIMSENQVVKDWLFN